MARTIVDTAIRTACTALVAALGSLGLPDAAFTQAAPPPWAGWARCQIEVQGPGYSEQAVHTWTMTGSTPTVEGAFRVYPGTWSVVGRGGLQRTEGRQTLIAQWAINGVSASAPLAVFVRASDGRMFIQARHAQQRSAGAITGYQQQIIDSMPQPPIQISREAFEWAFPTVDVGNTNTTINGSSAPGVNGSVGFMQPAGSRATASCTWQFGQGAAAPAGPQTLDAQATPTPANGSPPAGNAPASSSNQSPPLGGGAVPQLAGTTPTGASVSPPATGGGTTSQPTAGTPLPAGGQAQTPTLVVPTELIPIPAPPTGPTSSTGQPTTLVTSDVRTQAFTSSGTFTVPAGVTNVFIEVWGAGGGGQRGSSATSFFSNCTSTSCRGGAGGRGGGGGAWTRVSLAVVAGTTLSVVVGTGGRGGSSSVAAADGTSTLVRRGYTVHASAAGGKADGSGGVAATGMGAGVLPGNPGSPGGAPTGDFSLSGGAGGAGGAALEGSGMPPTPRGAGGRGGDGVSLSCSRNPTTGIPTNCHNASTSYSTGWRGGDGYALIRW